MVVSRRMNDAFIYIFIGILLRLIVRKFAPQDFISSIGHSANEDWERLHEEMILYRNSNVRNASESLSQPPLVLMFWKLINICTNTELFFWILELFAFSSFIIYDHCMEKYSNSESVKDILPFATLVYCFNPYSIVAFANHSVGIMSTLISVWTFIFLAKDFAIFASVLCGFGAYVSIYPAYVLLSILASIRKQPLRFISAVVAFAATLGGVLFCTYVIEGNNWSFLRHSYLSNIFARNTTPNMGVFWYMYVEMFDHFNDFFVYSMQLIIFGLCVAVLLRFYDDPMFLALLTLTSTGLLRPYNSQTEFGCSLALATPWRHLLPHFRSILFTGGLFAAAFILAPLFYFTWLRTGTSNANFYFAAALLHGLGRAQFVSQMAAGYMRSNFFKKYGKKPCLSNGIRLAPKMQ